MTKEKDYRNTEYCLRLEHVTEQKRQLEQEIKKDFPRTKIFYNKVSKRGSIHHQKFAKIYHEKCAYCGAMWGLLPTESFEVDHFINEAAFPDTTDGRTEAGRLENLVWSCISCNRGKQGLTIEPPYDELLNVDHGNITRVFYRAADFSIRISDTYRNDRFIQKFYERLHLGYETRRLDYLGLQIEGMYRHETDADKKCRLGAALSLLQKKRNRMTAWDGAAE